jgi:hypothetical protein
MTVLSREIDEFENAYISLLKKIKEHINRRYHELKNRHYSGPELRVPDEAKGRRFYRPLSEAEHRDLDEIDEYFNALDLMSTSFRIFSEVLGTYMLRSTILWPKDFRNMLNSAIFAKFSDIRIHMHDIFGSIKIPKGQVSLDSLFYDPMLDTATNLRESFEKEFNDPSMKKESDQVLTFVCKFIGNEMIRRAEYARTSKYTWDISLIDPEFIKKTIEKTYESLEDYENPFLKYKISL